MSFLNEIFATVFDLLDSKQHNSNEKKTKKCNPAAKQKTVLKTYQIINSEGEYITIDTLNNKKFYGLTWNYLLLHYTNKKAIQGIVSKIIKFKDEPNKIAGFNITIQCENCNHKITGFLPMRFADQRININDIVHCFVKEFDPESKRKHYSLVLQLAVR